jgi:hypothetical protein
MAVGQHYARVTTRVLEGDLDEITDVICRAFEEEARRLPGCVHAFCLLDRKTRTMLGIGIFETPEAAHALQSDALRLRIKAAGLGNVDVAEYEVISETHRD